MQWRFGDCALDLERRELHRAEGRVELEPQVFDLLVYLIHNRARVVSKDDLLKSVWLGRIVKDRVVDVKQVSRDLGVRYVLEGSARRSGGRMRINAQLVDATTGVHHWAERYDRDVSEMFAVQGEIACSVAAAVEPNLLAAEGTRTGSLSPADLSAWELVARAQSHFSRLTRSDYEVTVACLGQAIDHSPEFAPARALLGFALGFAAHMGWADKTHAVPAGRQHGERAIALDDRNPWGHAAVGYAAMMQRRMEESIAAFHQAVTLTPSSGIAHCHLSHGLAFAGRSEEAIQHGERAMRLSPVDPDTARFLGGIAIAHYTARRFDEALRYTRENVRLRPGFQGAQRLHAASLAQCGRVEEARTVLSNLLRTHHPRLTIAWARENVPYQTPELIELFLDGLRKAGLQD